MEGQRSFYFMPLCSRKPEHWAHESSHGWHWYEVLGPRRQTKLAKLLRLHDPIGLAKVPLVVASRWARLRCCKASRQQHLLSSSALAVLMPFTQQESQLQLSLSAARQAATCSQDPLLSTRGARQDRQWTASGPKQVRHRTWHRSSREINSWYTSAAQILLSGDT